MGTTKTQKPAAISSNTSNKKGKLFIVEDDRIMLKLFISFFSKHYDLKTAVSGNEALEMIKKGYKPEVILSDQRMPGMTGSEFLGKTIKYIPDSIRAIITAYSDPKEIISCINEGHAYLFLTKPIEEIELVQAVKLCFMEYDSFMKNKNLAIELKKHNFQLNKFYVT